MEPNVHMPLEPGWTSSDDDQLQIMLSDAVRESAPGAQDESTESGQPSDADSAEGGEGAAG